MGGADLYVIRRGLGGWGASEPLGSEANSAYADFAPGWSPDGQYLFFTSERPGIVSDVPEGARRPGDIYQISTEALGIR